MERPARRRANHAEVNRLQFETARRIIFGTEIISDTNPPREAWTSAGLVRAHNIQTNMPFTLGHLQFVIFEPQYQTDDLIKRDLAFNAVVCIRWNTIITDFSEILDTEEEEYEPTILCGPELVCIGSLQGDRFIACLPFFYDLYGVKHNGPQPESDKVFQSATVDQAGRSVFDFTLSGFYFSDFDYHEFEKECVSQYMELWPDQNVTYEKFRKQLLSPDIEKAVTKYIEDQVESEEFRLDLDEEVTWYQNHQRFVKIRVPYNDVTLRGSDEYSADYRVDTAVPFDQFAPYFDFQVPEEFMRQLCPQHEELSTPVRFGYAERRNGGVWRLDDVATILYAQCYIVHVLKGPDKRHFVTDPTDTSPFKETLPPPCLFEIRRDPNDVCLDIFVKYDNILYVSWQVNFRFFTSSLAFRSARVLENEMLHTTADFAQRLNRYLKRNPRALQEVHRAMQNFHFREFLGCHVCGTKQCDTPMMVKYANIHLCSHACYDKIKF